MWIGSVHFQVAHDHEAKTTFIHKKENKEFNILQYYWHEINEKKKYNTAFSAQVFW